MKARPCNLKTASAIAWFLVGFIVCFSAGCSTKPTRSSPEGAYRLFRKALFERDKRAAWDLLDAESRDFFGQKYRKLESMRRQIRDYLPPTDRKLALKKTGAVLANKLDGPRGLFKKTFRPNKITDDRAHRLGADIEAVELIRGSGQAGKDGERIVGAKIETRGGTSYSLTKNKKDQWAIDLLASVPLEQRFEWVRANRKALDRLVKKRKEKQRQIREGFIRQHFDVD